MNPNPEPTYRPLTAAELQCVPEGAEWRNVGVWRLSESVGQPASRTKDYRIRVTQPVETASETPRTDAAKLPGVYAQVVEADFARTLERELNAANERLRLARGALVSRYFKLDEVGDDIAPRIIEAISALQEQVASANARADAAEKVVDIGSEHVIQLLAERDAALAKVRELEAERDEARMRAQSAFRETARWPLCHGHSIQSPDSDKGHCPQCGIDRERKMTARIADLERHVEGAAKALEDAQNNRAERDKVLLITCAALATLKQLSGSGVEADTLGIAVRQETAGYQSHSIEHRLAAKTGEANDCTQTIAPNAGVAPGLPENPSPARPVAGSEPAAPTVEEQIMDSFLGQLNAECEPAAPAEPDLEEIVRETAAQLGPIPIDQEGMRDAIRIGIARATAPLRQWVAELRAALAKEQAAHAETAKELFEQAERTHNYALTLRVLKDRLILGSPEIRQNLVDVITAALAASGQQTLAAG